MVKIDQSSTNFNYFVDSAHVDQADCNVFIEHLPREKSHIPVRMCLIIRQLVRMGTDVKYRKRTKITAQNEEF